MKLFLNKSYNNSIKIFIQQNKKENTGILLSSFFGKYHVSFCAKPLLTESYGIFNFVWKSNINENQHNCKTGITPFV